jgi:hypothetical protein
LGQSPRNTMHPTARRFAQGGFVSRSLEEFKRLSQVGMLSPQQAHATPANQHA